MSEVNNWIANGDFSIHPIMRCNNCGVVFQGPHKCGYDDLMRRNKELRMELYDLKMQEATKRLFDSVTVSTDEMFDMEKLRWEVAHMKRVWEGRERKEALAND